jgi:tripartite-type tricarboxylate transporter receptor subunit TctC
MDGLLINNLTPIRLKMVTGFKTEQQDAMLLSGDADAGIGTYENYSKLIQSGDLVPVVRFGTAGYPESAMGVPTLAEVARPDAPSEIVEIAAQLSDMGRFMLAAPVTTDAQTAALRKLFDRVVVDEGYLRGLADAGLVGDPRDGETVQAFMVGLLGNGAIMAGFKKELACGQAISDGTKASCP